MHVCAACRFAQPLLSGRCPLACCVDSAAAALPLLLVAARACRLPPRVPQALDAAVRRHDPHALDALLMQFAAVIVSTTGAEVDRLEREIMVRALS